MIEKPPNPYERIGLSLAMENFQSTASAVIINSMTTTFLDQLETEGNDEAKIAGMFTFHAFLARSDSIPPKALKLYTTGIQSDRETLRIGTLDSLVPLLAKSKYPDKMAASVLSISSVNMC